ncbi:uncharacterized protein LOC118456201 isoform X2 [Anopheles albimanus]|uniref:Uncharacterized protein n=2 Tax=Anopheles albimanus TaxID=7167 RepID=A0A182F1J4_ANOAL|nr:uncharacterized protein LOC118456201 isoform X2 [Anopheles albimanus]XP_035772659.1 uncharacterized protein LOC118456201 isoform X2 [Anopheles albimanus]
MYDELNLSYESEAASGDWKACYQRDVQYWMSHELQTDPVMPVLVRTMASLAKQFQLAPAIEFSALDTLELLLVRAYQSWTRQSMPAPDALGRSMTQFLAQLPVYTVAVLDVVSKYIDASVKLDLGAVKRAANVTMPPGANMLSVEFEVMKLLENEFRSSLLLGAVERFTKQYLLPLMVPATKQKETIAQAGVKLLRIAIAERGTIYSSLKTSIKDETSFRRFKANKLILAGSITLAILQLITPGCTASSSSTGNLASQHLQRILEPLADDCSVQATNLLYLRDAILGAVGIDVRTGC